VFFRDFLGRGDLVQSFRFPRLPFEPKVVPTKEELRKFYDCLTPHPAGVLFLLYASTGLRLSEVLSLRRENIDISGRMVVPSDAHSGNTKKSWISFFNQEAVQQLHRYLKNHTGDLLFPFSDRKLPNGSEKPPRRMEFTSQHRL